jgi:hypothetical protein
MCSALKVEMPDKPSESPEQFRDRMVEVQTEFPEFLDQIWPNLTKFPGQFFGAFRVSSRLVIQSHDSTSKAQARLWFLQTWGLDKDDRCRCHKSHIVSFSMGSARPSPWNFRLCYSTYHMSSHVICPSGGVDQNLFEDSLGLVERRITEWRVLCLCATLCGTLW